MGKGIDAARGDSPIHAAVMDEFKDQLIIAMVRQLTNDGAEPWRIPAVEIDDTGRFLLAFKLEDAGGPNPIFHFELRRKS